MASKLVATGSGSDTQQQQAFFPQCVWGNKNKAMLNKTEECMKSKNQKTSMYMRV